MGLQDVISSGSIFYLGILLLLIGTLSYYFSLKINAQNHKINSMFELVSTMAQEINVLRGRILQSGQSQGINDFLMQGGQISQQIPFSTSAFNDTLSGSLNSDLIEISDDEASLDDADDDDADDDESLDESISDSVSESENIKTIQIGHTLEELDIPETFNIDETSVGISNGISNDISLSKAELLNEIKQINLDDSDKIIDVLDYKKLSLNKLREIVVEKGFVTDASKLKKPDILRLLEGVIES